MVDKWKSADGGIDVMAWEQLWRFTAASVGRMEGKGGKGKAKEIGQEVHLEAVALLKALLGPTIDEDGSTTFPTPVMSAKYASAKASLMSTLFQTISYLLSNISPHPPHRQLQLSSLQLLRPLVGYLKGQHPVLASLLPGVVSGMSKLVSAEGNGMKGDVAVAAAGLVEDVLALTLGDEEMTELGVLRGKVHDLSQLAAEWENEAEPLAETDPPPPSPTPSIASRSASKLDPFPPLTASYLSFTCSQLYQAIPPILVTLSSHPSDSARTASASLAASILKRSPEALSILIPACTRTLLFLSQDDFDLVRIGAQRYLRRLMSDGQTDLNLLDILSQSMSSLPRSITSGQDDKVIHEATIITAISEVIQATAKISSGGNAIEALLGPEGKVERWSWSLLDCLEFGKPAGWSAANPAARAAMLGWGQSPVSGLIEGSDPSSEAGDLPDFPHLPFRYVESAITSRAISRMLEHLGQAGGEFALHSVDYLLSFARNHRSNGSTRSAAALWIAERLLQGIADGQVEGPEGKVGKKTRRIAKECARVVVSIDEEEDDDGYAGSTAERDEVPSDALVERGKGINAITTLLDRPMAPNGHAASETRRLHLAAQQILLTCRGLSLLSTSARILSSSFRPLLLHALYAVIAHTASPHVIVRDYADTALFLTAYHTGYASPKNMILDNVDYVINVVSLRLSPSRLSIHAPLVLIAMIRLVGSEIVPLVHDVVDEIFDALDDYHGYETLASSLLAVLVTLIQVMAVDIKAEGLSEERLRKIAELRRVDAAPDPEKDFQRFENWYGERQAKREEEMADILQRAPQRAWSKLPDSGGAGTEAEGGEAELDLNDVEIPLTRSQEVCKAILEKSIYFLSHQNPFLRSRVLSLVAAAVPVLASANRECDLLPLIDRGWNVIITRLTDSEGYVVSAAAEVIASLAEHTGDFMGRRILDQAWPKFKYLLKTQQDKDQYSALAPVRGVRGGSTESSFTASFRLHMAILKAMKWVAAEVPVADSVVWEMAVAFRPFLDYRANADLRQAAREVYAELERRDEDAVWMVMQSTIGAMRQGVWSYIHLPGYNLDVDPERR